jgi:hypothetical protein
MWVDLAKSRVHWRVLVLPVLNIRVLLHEGCLCLMEDFVVRKKIQLGNY